MILTTMVLILSTLGQKKPNEVRLPITRDSRVSSVDSEARISPGGSPRLKLKSYQELSLFDIDPTPIRGRVVKGAVLHVRNEGEPPPTRVTVGSVAADWFEGKTGGADLEPGASSFAFRKNPDVPWTRAGGDLSEVILGRGGTLWRSAEASPPDARGWQTLAVEPSVVAARVAGVSGGFVLFDDEGTQWRRTGERFEMFPFPNRYVASREAGKDSAPYLTVTLGDEDRLPPEAPSGFTADARGLPPGEALVGWKTPADRGPAGVIGFRVQVDGRDTPRYLSPAAARVGEPVRMHLRDLDLKPGGRARVVVRAVDAAGNVGPEAETLVDLAPERPFRLPDPPAPRNLPAAPLPRLGEFEVAIVDELDAIDPVGGDPRPARAAGYLASNHLWDAAARTIRLQAARGEIVAFQVVIRGTSPAPVVPELSFEGSSIGVAIGRYQEVPTERGFAADPIVPLDRPERSPVPNRRSRSLHAELLVAKDAAAGVCRGSLVLKSGDARLALPVELSVLPFALPDRLSFLPEMNCYGLPEDERDYYRLAHAHRTVLNRVPYSQAGKIADGCAPVWDARRRRLDWDAWDRRFGPYLDGSAFDGLPRAGTPIECFYLPMHENWPTPMGDAYNGGLWADRAFPDAYRADFVEVARQAAAHCDARGWRATLFQGFLNNKIDFKREGWSRGSSPWLLDEPAHFQDFVALRYFGEAFHEGVRQAGGRARMVFRGDVSRPQWQRDALDGVLDYLVVGSAFRRYRSIVLDQKRDHGVIVVEYGSPSAVGDSNNQAVAWCVDVWTLGGDGVVPWQTIGRRESWDHADRLALLYPSPWPDHAAPIPSIRLKAYRRGQQDVEYLALLARARGLPRSTVAAAVRAALKPTATARPTGSGGEDAGVLDYDDLTPEDFANLRARVARALVVSPRPPEFPGFATPTRDLKGLKPWRASVDAATPGGRPAHSPFVGH